MPVRPLLARVGRLTDAATFDAGDDPRLDRGVSDESDAGTPLVVLLDVRPPARGSGVVGGCESVESTPTVGSDGFGSESDGPRMPGLVSLPTKGVLDGDPCTAISSPAAAADPWSSASSRLRRWLAERSGEPIGGTSATSGREAGPAGTAESTGTPAEADNAVDVSGAGVADGAVADVDETDGSERSRERR